MPLFFCIAMCCPLFALTHTHQHKSPNTRKLKVASNERRASPLGGMRRLWFSALVLSLTRRGNERGREPEWRRPRTHVHGCDDPPANHHLHTCALSPTYSYSMYPLTPTSLAHTGKFSLSEAHAQTTRSHHPTDDEAKSRLSHHDSIKSPACRLPLHQHHRSTLPGPKTSR